MKICLLIWVLFGIQPSFAGLAGDWTDVGYWKYKEEGEEVACTKMTKRFGFTKMKKMM